MLLNVIPFVHQKLKEVVTKEDITVDATCGNGFDTLELAKLSKYVYAFDVQDMAIHYTDLLLKENSLSNYKLIKDSHAFIKNYVIGHIKAVTFNLGYLPGSDKTIQTNESSTIEAIKTSCDLIEKGGIICITLYTGHEGGSVEAIHVEEFCRSLDKKLYKVVKYDFINREKSPYVIIIEKQ